LPTAAPKVEDKPEPKVEAKMVATNAEHSADSPEILDSQYPDGDGYWNDPKTEKSKKKVPAARKTAKTK